MRCILALSAGLCLLSSAVFGQTELTGSIGISGFVARQCSFGDAAISGRLPLNFTSGGTNALRIVALTDPVTLTTAPASIVITFSGACSQPHRVTLESQNNGLWRTGAGLAATPAGFGDAVPYTATLQWPPGNLALQADATSQHIHESALNVGQAVAGPFTLQIEIRAGATNRTAYAPLIAGGYGDTLRLKVEPQ